MKSPDQSPGPVPSAVLTLTEQLSLLSLTLGCFAIAANTVRGEGAPLTGSLAFGGIGFAATYSMIRWLGPTFLRAGLKGRDMSKPKKKEIPETMGAVAAVVYMLIAIIFIPLPFYKDLVVATSGGGNRDVVAELELGEIHEGRFLHRFPHNKLASYLSALLSLQSVIILGLGDDLFDIRWRHKFFIPALSSIPILIVYFVDFGVTQVIVPIPLRPYLGTLFNLGWLYYAYMGAIAIFCPNSINILAGINGLEVGQSIVIAVLLILNDMLYLLTPYPHPAVDSHLFSLYLLIPFVGVSLALWMHNRYPARVFVGDTYCYFAGSVFAIVGILGHFSKTLLLLFIPQIVNFVYSAPQLFKIIDCPRHRLPHYNRVTNLLEPSVTEWKVPPKPYLAAILNLLARCKLIGVKYNEAGEITETSNLTLLNLWLVWRGPLREDRLCYELLAVQVAVGCLGLWARHRLALLIFTEDNL